MKRGDIIRVCIECLGPDGNGFAEVNGRTLSVKGAVTGDEVDVRVLGVKRHSARVKIESIVSTGIERITPECSHFAECGGCKWQDIPYETQCNMKTELVQRTLASIPAIEPFEPLTIIPSSDVFFYRNKMEFSFDSPPGTRGKVFLGLHEAGKFDKVFDIRRCLLQSELSNRAVELTRDFTSKHALTAYGLKSHVGLLRFFMVRDGKNTGEVMLNIVTSGEEFNYSGQYEELLAEKLPEITTVVRTINRSKGNTSTGEEREILYGNGCISEQIGRFTFTISPDSFFQTNTHQAQNLYETIKEFSGLSGTERLLDLYCGTGTIGIYLAERAKDVTGVEMVESAVKDAWRNAEINGIDNITFLSGRVEDVVDETMEDFGVVICDPPRAGIHPKTLNHILRMRIPRMIYVSCNVRAIPHDLDMLAIVGYRIKNARVFDMSPHTPHIETVLLLEIE